MKKVVISIVSIILLSACSTTTIQTSKVQQPIIVEPSVVLEQPKITPQIKKDAYNNVFSQCKQCDTPIRLQEYFNSINYNI